MSNEEKEQRCKSCGKLLLDEKLPFCRRCVLEGRNKILPVGGSFGAIMATLGVIRLVNNNSDRNDATKV